MAHSDGPSAPSPDATTGNPDRKRLPGEAGSASRKTLLVMLTQVAGAGLGLVGVFLTGRYIPPGSLGSFGYASAIVGLLTAAGNLGISQAHQRHVSMGTAVAKANGVLLRLRLWTYGLITAVTTIGLWIYVTILHKSLNSTTPEVLIVVALGGVLSLIRQFPMDTWAAQQRVNRSELVKLVDTASTLVALVLVTMALGRHFHREPLPPAIFAKLWPLFGIGPTIDGPGVAYLFGMAYLAGKVVSMVPVLAWWVRDRMPVGKWDPTLARAYARFAMPVALTGVIALVLSYTDALVIGQYSGTGGVSEDSGYYNIAQRAAQVAGIATLGVVAVLFPRFTALFAQGKREAALEVFRSAERYSLMVTAAPVAMLVAMPKLMLHIIGDSYLAAAAPLQLLALSILVTCLAQPLANKFLGSNALRVSVIAAALSATINVVLNIYLVPDAGQVLWLPQGLRAHTLGFGPVGSSYATFVASLTGYVYLRVKARYDFGLPLVELPLIRILLAGLGTGAFWWWCSRLSSAYNGRVWQVGVITIIGYAIYALLLTLLRELRMEDIRFARGLINPKAMFNELRGKDAKH